MSRDSTFWQRLWEYRTDELQAWRRRWRASVISSLRMAIIPTGSMMMRTRAVLSGIPSNLWQVCVCVFSYAWWTAHSRWLKTEALWGRTMEANRVIVVLCWTKLVNCNSAQPKIPLHPPLFSLNLPQGVSTKFYKTVKIGHITNFWRSCWLERLWLLLYCLC